MPETNIVVSFVSDLIDRAKGLMQQNRASLNVKQADKTTQEKADEAAQGSQKEGRRKQPSRTILRPTAIGGDPPSLAQYWVTQQVVDQSTTYLPGPTSTGNNFFYRRSIGSGDGSLWIEFEDDKLPAYNHFSTIVTDNSGTYFLGFPFRYPWANYVPKPEAPPGSAGIYYNGAEGRRSIQNWFTLPAGKDKAVAIYRWKSEIRTRLTATVYTTPGDASTRVITTYDDERTAEGYRAFLVGQSTLQEITVPATVINAIDAIYKEQPWTSPRTVINAPGGVPNAFIEPEPIGGHASPTYTPFPLNFVHQQLQRTSNEPGASLQMPYEQYINAGVYGTRLAGAISDARNWPVFPSIYGMLLTPTAEEDAYLLLGGASVGGYYPEWGDLSSDMAQYGIRGHWATEAAYPEQTLRQMYADADSQIRLFYLRRSTDVPPGQADGYRQEEDIYTDEWPEVTIANYTTLSPDRVTPGIGGSVHINPPYEGPIALQVHLFSDGGVPGRCRANLSALGIVLP
jgi:hypothetical protein